MSWLSVGELATLLRVSEKTVYRLLHRREVAGAFKLGATWMIDREILLADLKERATKKIVRQSASGRHGL